MGREAGRCNKTSNTYPKIFLLRHHRSCQRRSLELKIHICKNLLGKKLFKVNNKGNISKSIDFALVSLLLNLYLHTGRHFHVLLNSLVPNLKSSKKRNYFFHFTCRCLLKNVIRTSRGSS